MIEKIADDLIGQMTEARLIDKEMEARYVYVFICWIEKFITVGSIIVISLMFHKLLPTIFFLVFFLELRKRCIFRKNRALAPHERSAVPLGTDHCPVG